MRDIAREGEKPLVYVAMSADLSTWFLTQMYARFWNDLTDHASA